MGIPLVALMGRGPQITPYNDQVAEAQQIQALKNRNALFPGEQQAQQQQLQLGQQELEQRKYQMDTQRALDEAYKSAVRPNDQGQPEIDTDSLTKALASAGHGSAVPSILEGVAKYQQTKNALMEQQQKLHEGAADMLGYAAAAVRQANYDPRLAHLVLDTLPASPQIQQMRQLIDTNPEAFKQQVDAAYAQSPKQQAIAKDLQVAQIRSEKNPTEASLALDSVKGDANAKAALGVLQDQKAEKNPTEVSLALRATQGDQDAAAALKRIQQGKIGVAVAEGQARASIEAQIARGSNAALANVPPHLVGPATAAATKAGEEYAAAKSVSDRMAATMDAAKRGNVVSYQIIPQEGTLQLTTSQGVHRINRTEIEQYAGGGSLWQRMEAHFGKALTGQSIPDSVLKDMAEIQKIQADGSETKYKSALKTINQNYSSNFKPVEMESLNSGSAPSGGGTTGGVLPSFKEWKDKQKQ